MTIKLSEAIREGAKLRPQSKRGFFVLKARDKTICSCALGAAYEGATGKIVRHVPEHIRLELKTLFPELTNTVKEGAADWVLGQLIIVKNDIRNETREEIADWVESQGY